MHGTERFKRSRAAGFEPRPAHPTNCYAPTVRRFTHAHIDEEVTQMYFTSTKLARSTRTATLLATLLLSTSAFAVHAGETTLADNERAARSAIADSPTYGRHVPSDVSEASLAYNERSAQHAITDTAAESDLANPGHASRVSGASDEATLTHNELSAQRAIVDEPAASRFSSVSRSSAALSSSASHQPAAAR